MHDGKPWWEPTEEDIANYLEEVYDPDFDIDAFNDVRDIPGHGYEDDEAGDDDKEV